MIELLVVISIIAILASLAMPTYTVIMRKAREVQAKAVMSSLVTAIKSFQVEYNKLPQVNPSAATPPNDGSPFDTGSGNLVMGCLTATDTTNNTTNNPRLIRFFDPPPLKSGSGFDTSSFILTDPWGMPFNIALDDNNDGVINNPYATGGTSSEPPTIPGTAIIWSGGSNKILLDTDDVKSWK